ncbi:MAG TPA: acyl carrier protein [Acidimicrobiales bacterium]|nr:acyl carrier protein [Acidimicrobiales bacterium]
MTPTSWTTTPGAPVSRGATPGRRSTVAPEVDLEGIDPAAPLQDAVELDSMDFVDLVTALCEETRIDVPERD